MGDQEYKVNWKQRTHKEYSLTRVGGNRRRLHEICVSTQPAGVASLTVLGLTSTEQTFCVCQNHLFSVTVHVQL